MADERLSQEQIVSRGVVSQIKATGRLHITTDSGAFYFLADKKLAHDVALAVQDFFRRTGRDYRRTEQ